MASGTISQTSPYWCAKWRALDSCVESAGSQIGCHVLGTRYPEAMPTTVVTPETLALLALLDAHRNEFRALLEKYGATNPRLFGSVARGTAHQDSDIDILVDMDPADGNLLMRASGLMEEARQLFGREGVDVLPVQLLKRPVSDAAIADAVAL